MNMNELNNAFAHLKNNDVIIKEYCDLSYVSKTRVNLTIAAKGYGLIQYNNITKNTAMKYIKSAMNL